jgi:hypothetical protein
MRAYYLAESGLRVVASEYTGATTVAEKNTVLENFHNNSVALPGNQGSFSVQLFPYWFYSSANYSDTDNTIALNVPGGVPLVNQDDPGTQITFPSSGLLKIKGQTKVVEYNSTPTISGNTITFTNVTIPAGYSISAGDELFFAFTGDPGSGNQAVADGGSLVLPGEAHILPSKNGSLKIGKHDYIYQNRLPEQIDPNNLPSTITLANTNRESSRLISPMMRQIQQIFCRPARSMLPRILPSTPPALWARVPWLQPAKRSMSLMWKKGCSATSRSRLKRICRISTRWTTGTPVILISRWRLTLTRKNSTWAAAF